MDEGMLIILVQGHECLYNLKRKDYDNNLVKDKCLKQIAREHHAQGKELSQTKHCQKMVGKRHGMFESAYEVTS
jgi:hypothetical protein